jgi:hypothetical protein
MLSLAGWLVSTRLLQAALVKLYGHVRSALEDNACLSLRRRGDDN